MKKSGFYTKRFLGFTLVELLITIAIIGIFSAIMIGSTTAARKKGRDNQRITDLKQMQIGLALYYDVYKAYPASLSTLVDQKFLPSIPVEPGSQPAYAYSTFNGNRNYCIGVNLEELSNKPEDNTTNPNCTINANYKVHK